MKTLIRCTIVALMLAPVAGVAQDLNAGLAAAEAGDYATALKEWLPLAEQGNAGAQNNLGAMYDAGKGVPQDYAEAARWYRLAAEQGDAIAQNNIGNMYHEGVGVPQDYFTAHMWLNIATAYGNKRGSELRDNVASMMTPADVSEAQRRARVCMESGYRDCN